MSTRIPDDAALARTAPNRRTLLGDLALYLLSAGFAVLTAATSTLAPHRAWGAIAWYGYAAAGILVLAQFGAPRRFAGSAARAAITGAAWVATALLPLVIQAAQRADGRTDRAQEEVVVTEEAGARLVDTGTPYLSRDAIAALPLDERLLGYTPYQPGMALFGLPRALAGDAWWTDARVWFAVATAAALLAAGSVLLRAVPRPDAQNAPATHDQGEKVSSGRPFLSLIMERPTELGAALVRVAQFATVLPLCALTLATGGDDLPVLALCLLALACAARAGTAAEASAAQASAAQASAAEASAARAAGTHPSTPHPSTPHPTTAHPSTPHPSTPHASTAQRWLIAAGLAVGAAGALKLFAWPVALVLLVFAAAAFGRRGALAYGVPAAGLPLLCVGPALIVDASAALENLLRFPLGRGLVTSPAQSPLPGHLIATGLPGGRIVATALLVLAGLVIAGWLLRRPPRDAAHAAAVCAVGMVTATLLLPATRFGYLLYPVAYAFAVPALRLVGSRRAAVRRTQEM